MLHIDNDEVRTLYEPGREIDTFEDVGDLIAKARYWLRNDDDRRVAAERGNARAVPAYSLEARASELQAVMGKWQ
jgi:spore maturation protein CgeB